MNAKALAWLLGLVLLGCGSSGSHDPDSNPPHVVPQADFLIGAGLVHGWYLHPREIVDANADAGLTFTEIEWVSDQQSIACPRGAVRPNDWFGTDMRAAEDLVAQASKRNITVLINIANANNCAVMSQPDIWFLDRLEEVLVISANNPEHVLISPVSEPWAAPERANRWIALARQRIPAEQLVSTDFGAYLDRHYCDPKRLMDDLTRGNPRIIHNTDCSPILNPGPGPAATLAKAAKNTHSPLMIYDFYSRDMSSLGLTIQAMGEAIK